MKLVIAPDSFKGALAAPAVAAAIAAGWRRVFPEAECVLLPVADGGEGTLDALLAATGGERRWEDITGPLGEPHRAAWGLLPDGTGVIELAQAAGLPLVPPERRDPCQTTTRGVGELIQAALPHARRLIIGLGGSATNDGGAGILDVFVYRQHPGVAVQIACDVDNPLTGPRGAAAVFGPQKGATPEMIPELDARLAALAARLGLPERPGDGAAGGAAYGLRWLFPDAELVPGIDLVLSASGFDRHVADATLVLTGEGRLDSQTLGGKVVAGVARRAGALGVPVAALVGGLAPEISGGALTAAGVAAVLPIAPGPCTLAESMDHTATWLADTAERAARWWGLGH